MHELAFSDELCKALFFPNPKNPKENIFVEFCRSIEIKKMVSSKSDMSNQVQVVLSNKHKNLQVLNFDVQDVKCTRVLCG